MTEYNKRDVILLEEVYLKLRPWMKGNQHPNAGNFFNTSSDVCCKCGSTFIDKIPNEYYYTTVNKYEIYRCRKCGAISRARKSVNKMNVKQVNIGH